MLRRRESPTSQQESEMAASSLRELYAIGNTADPVQRLRLLCLSRGANGILILGRVFRKIYEHGNKKLTLKEFMLGLRDVGLDVNDEEAKHMFEHFDSDKRGRINLDEFLVQIRPEISELRKKIIDEAFQKMDKTGDGEISIETLRHVYNVQSEPRYKSGEESEEKIMKRFLDHFEQDAIKDGIVTREDFYNYYSVVSASIDNDCYFNLMLRQAYKL